MTDRRENSRKFIAEIALLSFVTLRSSSLSRLRYVYGTMAASRGNGEMARCGEMWRDVARWCETQTARDIWPHASWARCV